MVIVAIYIRIYIYIYILGDHLSLFALSHEVYLSNIYFTSALFRKSPLKKVLIHFGLVSLFNGISTFVGYFNAKPFS